MKFACHLIPLAALLMLGGGCQLALTGDIQEVQPISDHARAGNAYLVRGWIGVFSLGIDKLGDKLEEEGIRARVYQEVQSGALAEALVQAYRGQRDAEPLILIGHSYGADDVVRIARRLNEAKIPVDLLVTLDPVVPGAVSPNVRRTVNLFRPNGVWDAFPWLRGIPLKQAVPGRGELTNIDIRHDRPELMEAGTNHFTIDKNERVQQAVIEQVLLVCPRREEWTAMKRGMPSGSDVETPHATVGAVAPVAPSGDGASPSPRPFAVGGSGGGGASPDGATRR